MLHGIYRIKKMFRSKSLIFWSLAFPLFLGLLFYFMFGNIPDMEQFSEVPVGVIHAEENEEFLEVLKTVEIEEGTNMFAVTEYEKQSDAEKELEEKNINGYIDAGDDLLLTVKESDIYSSIIKTFLDQYKQNVVLIENMMETHPERLTDFMSSLSEEQAVGIKEIPLKGQDKNPYAQYFYALIAMTCLIGTMMGLSNGNDIQADLSTVGARRNIAPMSKMKQVVVDFLATYFIYCIITTIVLAACVFVYQQDFGNNALFILLGTWIGSFTGIAIGTMVAVMVKGTSQSKEGICVAVFMTSSFLGGLQWGEITYILEKNCPIINRINPATLIVNSFKSVAVFGDYKQYAVNLLTLFVIGMLCLVVSGLKLRRAKYASL